MVRRHRFELLAACLAFGCPKARPVAPTDVVAPRAAVADAMPRRDWSEPWPVKYTAFGDLVPASTAFLLLNDAPLPDEALATLKPVLDPLRAVAEEGLFDGEDEFAEEFGGKLDAAGLARVGIDANPMLVAYTVAGVPVLRVRLADATRFDAWMAEKSDASDADYLHDFHGQRMYAKPEDGKWTVLAINGEDIVVAFVPEIALDEVLPVVFGQRAPSGTLHSTGLIKDIEKSAGLRPHYLFMLNVERAAALVFGVAGGLEREVGKVLDFLEPLKEPGCAEEFARVFTVVPRVWFGFREIKNGKVGIAAVAELRRDVGDALRKMVGPIPGLPKKRAANEAIGVGVGINPREVVAAQKDVWAPVLEHPFRCPAFAAVNEFAREVEAWKPARSSLASVTGAAAVVTSLDPAADPPVDGYAVVGNAQPALLLEDLSKRAPLDLSAVELGKVYSVGDIDPTRRPAVAGLRFSFGDGGLAVATDDVSKGRLKVVRSRFRPDDGTFALVRWDLRKQKGFREILSRERDPDPLAQAFIEVLISMLLRGNVSLRLGDDHVALEGTFFIPKET